MPNYQVYTVTTAAAAAALGVYIFWIWSTRGRRAGRQLRRKTSEEFREELRSARLSYFSRRPSAASGSEHEPIDELVDDHEPESFELTDTEEANEGVAMGRLESRAARLKPALSVLSVERARAQPHLQQAKGACTPTSPVRAMLSKRANSVIAIQSTMNSFHSRYLYAPHPPIADPSFDSDTGAPVVNPIDTVDGLLKWCAGFDEFCVAWCPLQRRVVTRGDDVMTTSSDTAMPKPRVRLVACHDMQGGYLDDRLCQGAHGRDPSFYLQRWNLIDTFIYFSHHLVTLPPPAWTNAAHLHGVPVLGTFITEWDAGAEVCRRAFSSVETAHMMAEKLATMAQYYHFDGWLINIENEIEKESVPVMCEFLQHLTRRVHELVGRHGCVLWYDSITKDGKLVWQNALNAMNCNFYDSCDGIFLNYNWTDSGLEESQRLAGVAEAPDRVFVGIDVFGRGCPGGGGFNSIEALESIADRGLSAALFAFGWVWETQNKEHFAENDKRFWSLLAPRCVHFAPASLPLWSSFSLGVGSALYQNGKRIQGGSWCHYSMQDLQPNALLCQSSSHVKLDAATLCSNEAFNGSHHLSITGVTSLQAALENSQPFAKDCAYTSLYRCQAGVAYPLVVSVAHRTLGPVDVALALFVILPSGRCQQIVLPLAADEAVDSDTEEADALDKRLLERYGVRRSRTLPESRGWAVERLVDAVGRATPVSRNTSLGMVESTASNTLNCSFADNHDGGVGSPYSSSATLADVDLSSPLAVGFASLRGTDYARLESLSTGIHRSELERNRLRRWKTSHFLVAGQHIRSFQIKEVAVLCKPSSTMEDAKSFSSSVDLEEGDFKVKLGELRLSEARWMRHEYHEVAFGLRCGGVQWDLCPSIGLQNPAPLSASGRLSVQSCTTSFLDMTLLWDHSSPSRISHFDIYVYGLDEHRRCLQPTSQATAAHPTGAFTATADVPPSDGPVPACEDDDVAARATADPDLVQDMPVDGIEVMKLALSSAASTPAATHLPKRPSGKPEFLGRAYGLSYHISRLALVVKKEVTPTPDILRKTTSISSLATGHSASSAAPSPSMGRRPSRSAPPTPGVEARCPQQFVWFTVQAVSRAGFRLPLEEAPSVRFSWS